MDIPILNQLEKIYPNQDTGAQAIRKLVKNQNLIEQGIKELDITESGKDLEEIRQQINVLSDDRGYLSTKQYIAVDLNTMILNGKFYVNGPTNTPVPSGQNNNGYLEVIIANSTGYISQVFTQTVTGTKWFRVCSGGTWLAWQQIATTTKTSFLCTAKAGYTIVRQNCFVQNNFAYINVLVKKTDETAFTVGNFDIVTNPKPPSIRTPANVLCHNVATGSGIISGGNGYITETSIATVGFVNNNTSTKSVIISGSYPIA